MIYADNQTDYPLQDEKKKIIGLPLKCQNFRSGILETVYKDTLEHKLNLNDYLLEENMNTRCLTKK